VAPFDDVCQSAYYMPWALVKQDEAAGVEAQTAWLDFKAGAYARSLLSST
jgi:hypothetical protein